MTVLSIQGNILMWRCDPYNGTYKCNDEIHTREHTNVTVLSTREYTNVTMEHTNVIHTMMRSIQGNIRMWRCYPYKGTYKCDDVIHTRGLTNVTMRSIQGNIKMWLCDPYKEHTIVTLWSIGNIQMWRCDPYKRTYKCDGVIHTRDMQMWRSDPYNGTYICDVVIDKREHTNETSWYIKGNIRMFQTGGHTPVRVWSIQGNIQMWRCDPYNRTYKCDVFIHTSGHTNVTMWSIWGNMQMWSLETYKGT